MNAPASLAQGLAHGHADLAVTHASRVEMTLPTPGELRRRLPVTPLVAERLHGQRRAIQDIVCGRDDRLLVVVGPCSIHDPLAALEYAHRLAELVLMLRKKPKARRGAASAGAGSARSTAAACPGCFPGQCLAVR